MDSIKILGIILLFTVLLISGIYFKVTNEIEITNKYNIGDCILSKSRGYWETEHIKKIIYVDKDVQLYGINYIRYDDITSHHFSDVEYKYRKIECPN